MAKWLNYASNFLDDLDSSAKEHIAKDGPLDSAIERRARRRQQQQQKMAASEDAKASDPSRSLEEHDEDVGANGPNAVSEGNVSTSASAGAEESGENPKEAGGHGNEQPGEQEGEKLPHAGGRDNENGDENAGGKESVASSAPDLRSRSPVKVQAATLPIKSWIRLRNLNANTKPSLLLAALAEAEEALAAQTVEMEQVCLELEREEVRREDVEEDLKAAGEALAHATRKAAARESELRDTIADLKRSRVDADKSARISITTTQKEADEAKTALEAKEAEIERLAGALAEKEKEQAEALQTIEELRTMGSQGMQGVRAEVRVLESKIEEMEAQHSSAMRTLRRREAELERTNTELTRTLADKERAISALRGSGQDDFSGGLPDADSLLREEAIAASTALRSERQKCEELGAELEKARADLFQQTTLLEEQLSSTTAALRREEAQRSKLEGLLSERDGTLKSLEGQLRDQGRASARGRADARGEVVEERIKAMTEQLMKKQLALDEANCEKAALRARLGAAATRITKLEGDVQKYMSTAASAYGDDEDVEEGGLRRRRKAHTSISVLLKPVTKSEGVSKAVDSLDRFVLYTGRVLRANAVARAVFLAYLFMLHLWTFTLIAFHTHVTLEP
uniref:Golgin-84 n=1 Tax=Pinguiococcus pyrenoidosus TaxID=172671 RepID=A0A7R9U461_9STRA|mmetsp:Transcript_12808/g.47336  ORF Transcript_12808/g.47336 Transcript_12808/m.47336 type:complete len:629 (+) Transcript_12808:126-2012(+)